MSEHREESMRLWSNRIAACKTSGLTVKQWCTQNGIHEKSYWYWHKIVKGTCTKSIMPSTNAIYEVPGTTNTYVGTVATIRKGDISIDVYTSDATAFVSACNALKLC